MKSVKVNPEETRSIVNDPYVKKVSALAGDKTLFSKSPHALKTLRRTLLKESLHYFIRRNPEYYTPLLDALGITPDTAVLEDLVALSIPSDVLRGDTYKKMMINPVVKGGAVYHSSGTTGQFPITVYKSPLDQNMINLAVPQLVSHQIGYQLNGGLLLMLCPSEMVSSVLFGVTAHYYESRGIKVLYGACMKEPTSLSEGLPSMTLNNQVISDFIHAPIEPKYIFSAPVGMKKLLEYAKKESLTIDLGKGGFINTGGGAKGTGITLETLWQMREDTICAQNEKGEVIPAPWYDGIGHTEGLLILFGKKNSLSKVPHPLEEVFIVDEQFKIIEEGQGFAAHWNPLNTTYFEAFYPGDFYQVEDASNFYGKTFTFVRRLDLGKGKVIRPGCGALVMQ